MKGNAGARLAGCAALLGISVAFGAKLPPEEIAKLDGPQFTCMGSTKAGSADGVIPEYGGKWLGAWPGLTDLSGYTPGPYVDDKPLFTITAANMQGYAEKLTEGQKALLEKYPDTFRMRVFPTHRDFRIPDWACEVVKRNAAESELVHDGRGITGVTGNISFPFPASGDEAIWNVIGPYRPWSEQVTHRIANVHHNGTITWGQQRFISMAPYSDPVKRGSKQDRISSYFLQEYLLPPRDRGSLDSGWQPNDFLHDSTTTWQYNPGTRRVRQAPEVGFDYPIPPSGAHTVDDNYVFNGSPERYDWKIVGQREVYLPMHSFEINDPALKYKDLLTAGTINPDRVRYELRRVWVVQGDLKPGVRHIYKKRVIYADADTWIAPWGDNYDRRGELWRVSMVNLRYAPDAQSYHRTVSVYHDLEAGSYEVIYLVNEEGPDAWWRMNDPALVPDMFGASALSFRGR